MPTGKGPTYESSARPVEGKVLGGMLAQGIPRTCFHKLGNRDGNMESKVLLKEAVKALKKNCGMGVKGKSFSPRINQQARLVGGKKSQPRRRKKATAVVNHIQNPCRPCRGGYLGGEGCASKAATKCWQEREKKKKKCGAEAF